MRDTARYLYTHKILLRLFITDVSDNSLISFARRALVRKLTTRTEWNGTVLIAMKERKVCARRFYFKEQHRALSRRKREI